MDAGNGDLGNGRKGGSGNVVPFDRSRSDMRFSALADVRAYWEALRDGRAAPYRSEVDPRGIERSLEHAFVLERIAPRATRFRVAGMHLNDLMGMEVRGMPFSALFTPRAREELGSLLASVFSGPRTAEMALSAETGLGKPAIEGAIVLLPLRSDLGDVSRILGCLVTEGAIGRAPRRFDIRKAVTFPIGVTAPDHGVPQRASPQPVPPPAPRAAGFAEAAQTFAPAQPDCAGRRGHLRLVVTRE